ncbi:hypothetical protein ABBQ32_012987 [Trebouxia sp. C0010 RCD-2024]
MHRSLCEASKGLCHPRPLFTTLAYSRYALRLASGLPDWNSSSPSADPAALPSDLPDNWSQAPAHVDLVAAGPVQDGPFGAAVSLIDHLHSVTGLPWWATLSVTALGVRAALFPLAVRQIQATAGIAQIWKQVQQVRPSNPVFTRQQQLQHTYQNAARLLKEHSLPSPLWIVAAPLAQIPVFLTVVMAVRRMSASAWPGFGTGGLFWFTDLCEPALKLAAASAPLGSIGVLLPAGVALAMFANIQRSFGATPSAPGSAVMVWVMGNIRLLLEWLTVPLFIIALQLPQGAVLYWLVSSLTALAQGYILQAPSARAALGLPSTRAAGMADVPLTAASQQGTTISQPPQEAQTVEAAVTGHNVEGKLGEVPAAVQGTKGNSTAQPVDMVKLMTLPAAIQSLAAGSSDAHAMLLKVC